MDRMALFQQFVDEKRTTTIVHEHYLNTLREYAPGTNLYMREIHFLMAADPRKPVSVTSLAKTLDVTLGAASQMATKLEKKGLIVRSPDPDDRRRTMVSLTEEGRLLHQAHIEYDRKRMSMMNDLFRGFSDEDLRRLIEAEVLFRYALRMKEEN